MISLRENYKKAVPALKEKYKNVMSIPRITKVVVNTGLGKMTMGGTGGDNKKIFESVITDLSLICGQKVVLTKAKKSIAVYKTRTGMPIGAKVTLRGPKMSDFLERVINIALPRSRDFQGINSKSLDGAGNLTIPIKEHTIFPEIMAESTRIVFGFEITVVTSAKNKEDGLELLRLLEFPIKKDK